MRTIGIRANPGEVTIAIYDLSESTILNVEKIKIPKALHTPDALKYIRNTILDVLREYKIAKAGLRVTESNAQNLNIRRLEIEGVIQEAFASSDLQSYFLGQISNISSLVGFERKNFKYFVDGRKVYSDVENWESLRSEEREAVLTALGAANVNPV